MSNTVWSLFTDLAHETNISNVEIEGDIPAWLNGTLFRTGPAQFTVGDDRYKHWFDGLALLHKFEIDQGQVSYASRMLNSEAYQKAMAKNRIVIPEFGTFGSPDPCQHIFAKLASYFQGPTPTDNGNINLLFLKDRLVSLTETLRSHWIDPTTLSTEESATFPSGISMQVRTAHIRRDQQGYDWNIGTHYGPRCSYKIFNTPSYASSNKDLKGQLVASIPVTDPAYIHSFGATPNFVILTECPLTTSALSLVGSKRPFISHFKWNPSKGTKFYVIDKSSGKVRKTFSAPAFFTFHHVNAFEKDNAVFVDISCYDDPEIIDKLYLDNLQDPQSTFPPSTLRRYRLPLDAKSSSQCSPQVILPTSFELPRISPRVEGQPYNFAYGVGVAEEGQSSFLNELIKVNVNDGSTRRWQQADCFPSEPIFVPNSRSISAEEDDGVVLSVVIEPGKQRSFLLVLDAQEFTELARA